MNPFTWISGPLLPAGAQSSPGTSLLPPSGHGFVSLLEAHITSAHVPQFPMSLGRAPLLFPEDTLHLGMYGHGPVGRHILPAAGRTQHTALLLTSLSQNLILLSLSRAFMGL